MTVIVIKDQIMQDQQAQVLNLTKLHKKSRKAKTQLGETLKTMTSY